MSSDGTSLLSFLDAPVVVGDPEGRVIYVNPAFEQTFDPEGRTLQGTSFAELFAGGGREAFLVAVAEVCQTGETVRFRLREDGRGYIGVASPIEAQADRVGVVILLSDEPFSVQRLLAMQRELDDPLDELGAALEQLAEDPAVRGAARPRAAAANALAAVERARKGSQGLRAELTGEGATQARKQRLDPLRVVRAVHSRCRDDFARSGVVLDVIAPASLPQAQGEGRHLETVLLRMLRDRLEQCDRADHIALGARVERVDDAERVLFSVVAPGRSDAPAELRRQRDSIAALGGFHHVCVHSAAGRATVIALPLASG